MSEAQPPHEVPQQSRLWRWLIRLCIILMLCGGLGFLVGQSWLEVIATQKGPHTDHVLVRVQPGDGHMVLQHKLAKHQIIHDRLHYQIYAFVNHSRYVPKAGEYLIEAGASLEDIFIQLDAGITYQRRITIIEGLRSFDIMNILNEAEGLRSVILSPPDEGSIFPDTYFYVYDDDRRSILARMQQKMEMLKAEIWAERDAGLPLKSPEELVILASIIEKEAGNASERPLIASVFVNRLNAKMRLQSDPTVAYGLYREQPLPQRLSRRELKTPHRWNSYMNAGLPPTPIANPSYASLYAAAHPAQTDYFYFVADGEGGHNFARTLAEHNRNVRIYRKKMKNRSAGQ